MAAVAIAGAMLIFGGELNDFARRLCYVALVGRALLEPSQIVAGKNNDLELIRLLITTR